jgi:hypothetical protein
MTQMVEIVMMIMNHHLLLQILLHLHLLHLLPIIHQVLHLNHHLESIRRLSILLQPLLAIGPSGTSDNPKPGEFYHLQLSARNLNLMLSKVKGILVTMLKLICNMMAY